MRVDLDFDLQQQVANNPELMCYEHDSHSIKELKVKLSKLTVL